MGYLELCLCVCAEAEYIPAGAFGELDHQRPSKLGLSQRDRAHLHIWERGVIALRFLRMPDEPNVGDDIRPEALAVSGEVPDFVGGAHDLLARQQLQRSILDDRAAQLELSVEARGVVRLVDRLHGREEAWGAADEVGEDELEARVVEVRHHVQRLCGASQPRFGATDLHRDDRIVANREVGPLLAFADPNDAQIRDEELSTLSIIPLGVLDVLHSVDDTLTATRRDRPQLGIETDLAVLPAAVLVERAPLGREACAGSGVHPTRRGAGGSTHVYQPARCSVPTTPNGAVAVTSCASCTYLEVPKVVFVYCRISSTDMTFSR